MEAVESNYSVESKQINENLERGAMLSHTGLYWSQIPCEVQWKKVRHISECCPAGLGDHLAHGISSPGSLSPPRRVEDCKPGRCSSLPFYTICRTKMGY